MNYQSQSYSSDYNEDGGDGFGDFPTTNRNVNDILNDNRWKANKEKNSFNEQYSQSNVNGWQNGLGSLNINDLNSQTYMNHDNNQNSNNNHNNSQNYSNTMNGNHYENTENEIDNQQRLMNFLNNDPHDKQQYDNNHNNNQNNGINYDDFNNNYSNYNDIDDGRLNIAHITGDSDSDLSDSDEKYNHGKIDKTNREKIDKDVKIKKKRERKGKKSNKLSTPLVTEHTANASQSIQQSIAASTGPPISSVSYTQHSTQPSVQPSAAVSTEVNTQNMHGLLGPGHPSIHPSTHPSMHSSIGRTRGPSTAFYPNENNTLLPGLSLSPGNDPQYEQTLRINSYNNINKNDGHDGYLLSNLTVEGDSHLNGIRSDLYQGTGGQGSVLGTSRRDVASSRRRGPLIDKAIDNSLPDHTTITSNAGDSSNSSGNSNSNSSSSSNDISDVSDSPFSWVCKKCTYKHDELSERRLVACSLCGSDRYPTAAPPVQASVPVSVGNNILTSSSWGAKMAMAEKKIKEKEKESSGENGFTDVGGRSKKKVEVVVDDNEYAYNGKYDKYRTTPTSTDYSQAPRVGGGSVVYCHDYQNTRGLCSRGDKCRYVHEKVRVWIYEYMNNKIFSRYLGGLY